MAISSPPSPAHADDAPAHGPDSLTVLYDADCGVCREAVRQLRRWDRDTRLEFLPFDAASSCGRPLLERLAAERPLGEALHVVDETTGEVAAGGHAALAILDALPGGWLLRPWTALPATAVAADLVYRVARRHRDRVAWLVGLRDDVACPIEPHAGAHRHALLPAGTGPLIDRTDDSSDDGTARSAIAPFDGWGSSAGSGSAPTEPRRA